MATARTNPRRAPPSPRPSVSSRRSDRWAPRPRKPPREVGVAIAHAMLCGAASLGQPFCENDHGLAAAPGLLTRCVRPNGVIKCELTLCSLLANHQLAYG